MGTPKQKYIESLNEIAKRYGALEDVTVRRSVAMLQDLRAQIADQLTAAGGWEAYRLQELQRNIERLIADYQAKLSAEVRRAFADTYRDGALSVTEPLSKLGIQGAFFQPMPSQINVLLDFSAQLVKGIADELRNGINTQLRLAALGQKSPLDAMKAVTDVLGIEARAGVWAKRPPVVKGVAARAETIVRTEMQRTFNLANYSQQQATAKQVPGLLKTWIATADSRTRPSHLQAHVQYRQNPIPVDEPFVLTDAKLGRAELMYPGDPNAAAGWVVNCRCRTASIVPSVGIIGSSLDGRIAQELDRRAA
jgi:hypothetical protein